MRENLVGTTVKTKYNNLMYRIEGIDFSRTPTATFDQRDGTK